MGIGAGGSDGAVVPGGEVAILIKRGDREAVRDARGGRRWEARDNERHRRVGRIRQREAGGAADQAAVDQARVVYVLCAAFRQRRDLEVKRAAATALLVLVTERSGPSPSPPERPAADPDLEGEPRVRDKLSSERVDQWSQAPK
jgi:hypothetical protein